LVINVYTTQSRSALVAYDQCVKGNSIL